MDSIALRDLQQRGAKALPHADRPVVVTGRSGPLFLLVPADPGNLAEQEREIRRAMARADLRAWQERAVEAGLDRLSDEEIEAEIAAMRAARRGKAGPRRR